MKAYTSPQQLVADAFTTKVIATLARHRIEIIGQDSTPSLIRLQIGSTAIDISTVTKATHSDKSTTIVTPQPVPARVAGVPNDAVRSAHPSLSLPNRSRWSTRLQKKYRHQKRSLRPFPRSPPPAPPLVESMATESISVKSASNATSMPAVPAESDVTIQPINPSLVVETVPSLEEITESPTALTAVSTKASLPLGTI